MTTLVWMSDPHFQNTGTINGLNPRTRLSAAIEHANTHYADAAFGVLSGDLVGDDIEGDYAQLAHYLSASELTLHAMIGNNDDRAGYFRHLSTPDPSLDGFVQFALGIPEGRVLCLDTHKVGSAAGAFCDARMAWLERELTEAGDHPVFLFMHHPPMDLGLPRQDEIKLENGDAFLETIKAHGNVAYMFMGHVHRPTTGVVQGIPFASLGALSFQAPAPRPDWGWSAFKAPTEAPHYAVVEITGADVRVQFVQFGPYELGIE